MEDAEVRIGGILKSPKYVGLVSSNDEIQGFLAGNIIRIERNDIFELKEMCVSVKHQRKGGGSRLLAVLRERLLEFGVSSICLQISHETPTFDFYVKNGFTREEDFSSLILPLKNN